MRNLSQQADDTLSQPEPVEKEINREYFVPLFFKLDSPFFSVVILYSRVLGEAAGAF